MTTTSDAPAGPDAAIGARASEPSLSGQAVSAVIAALDWHARRPDRIAVIDADGAHTYTWLARAVDRVASAVAPHAARGEHLGVTRRPAGAAVAGVLGCVKAGAEHTVIEPDGPVAPQFLGVTTVLDVRTAGALLDGAIDLHELVAGPQDQARPPSPDTNGGSAGEVAPTAGEDWAVARFGLRSDDRFAVLSTRPGHSVAALSSAMSAGAAVLAAVPSLAEPDALADWLRANDVTVMYASTPVLRAITARAAEGQLQALRYAFIDNSGELLAHDVEALRRVAPACRCVGTYRMSRAGRPVAIYAVPDAWRSDEAPLRLPLGSAGEAGSAGDQARLLGAADRTAAVGEVGEVCLGSYRTGDLARRWPDGTLEFVGRVGGDRNVDPIETLAALRDLPDVRDAAVAERFGLEGEPVLVGYVTGPDPDLNTNATRRSLSLRLPDRLVPERLFVVEALPLTTAGDYDLDALPDTLPETQLDEYVAPRTPMEHELTRILQELLQTERVGVHDVFFELGGFSLLATQLATRIRESFGVELSLRDVFEAPTVGALAPLIVRRQVELSGSLDLAALLDEIEQTDSGAR